MGVTNLLPQLKDIQQQVSLADYKGKTLAVDAYGWLHRGLILCAQDLCLNKPTQSYITSVMKKVDMLRYFGVEPYLVFDGSPLPTKEATALERREKRRLAREAANNYVKMGNKKAAWKEFMKAAGVTPEMAKAIMVELDRKRVKYVVAPYEADPQMVYLEKIGLVDGILSEDSDLLVFGCKKLITKLNDHGGCVEIDRAQLCKLKTEYHKFSDSQWRSLAILSGCDYTKGIPGVGMKTAYNAVVKHVTWDAICDGLATSGKYATEDFMEEAAKADLAFQFSKVFNPVDLLITTLNDYPSDFDTSMELVELCCGRSLEPAIQIGICLGKLHPSTYEPLFSRELLLLRGPKTTTKASNPGNGVTPRSIESFFTVQKPVGIAMESQLQKSVKNHCDKSIKLSPNAKKLKRLVPKNENIAPGPSKFFSSLKPQLESMKQKLAEINLPKPALASSSLNAPFEAHSSFLTGDSEVPDESSSPLKAGYLGETVIQYLTDDDEDDDGCLSTSNSMVNSVAERPLFSSTLTKSSINLDSEPDEGYEHDIEESPIKMNKVVTSWRSQFLMKEAAETVSILSKSSQKLKVEKALKNKITKSELTISHGVTKFNRSVTSTSVEVVKSAVVKLNFLQRSQLSESEADSSFSQSTNKPSVNFKLLKFAFSGH